MIRGFVREALVVYPLWEDYSGRSREYQSHINKAAENVKEYLKKCNIDLHSFVTDDVARTCSTIPDNWVLTLGTGDMFFVKTNCEGMDVDYSKAVRFPDIYSECAEKYPISKTMSKDGRFEAILQRDGKARREIVKNYNFIILFKQPKSPALRLQPKEGSGKLIITIDNTTFLPECYMSDMRVDPIDLLGIPNANMPAYEWEVDNAH